MFSTNKHNKAKQLIKMIVGKYSVIGNVMGLVKCGRYSTLLSPDLRAVRRPQMKATNAHGARVVRIRIHRKSCNSYGTIVVQPF